MQDNHVARKQDSHSRQSSTPIQAVPSTKHQNPHRTSHPRKQKNYETNQRSHVKETQPRKTSNTALLPALISFSSLSMVFQICYNFKIYKVI